MFLLRRPTDAVIDNFLKIQSGLKLTYLDVGATATVPPSGFVVDHTRNAIGQGEAVYQRAREALVGWQQFSLGWVSAWPATAPIAVESVVAVVAKAAGLWWLNACKIVYTFDETADVCRFGFAYGTLPGHAGRGEERFSLEWHRADDQVWYDILAFSRPNRLLPRIGYPLMRRRQKRFGRESTALMRRIVTQ